jgi:glyoxylate/hydroxypyruvate reductase
MISPMSILFVSKIRDPIPWKALLEKEFPNLTFYLADAPHNPEEIHYALVWLHDLGQLNGYPHLKLIQNLGAGVDHLMRASDVPADVPISRLEDAGLAKQMTQYVAHFVLRFHRQFHQYDSIQTWRPSDPAQFKGRVSVLGAGVLGHAVIQGVAQLGYSVSCWRNRPIPVENAEVYTGADGLSALLNQTDILVCLLPLTPSTEGILCKANLDKLPSGACLINVGRGAHLIEEDLIPLLDSGRLGHVVLDVFSVEPLPSEHPFWSHPNITVTPHISALTIASLAQSQVLENIQRCESGQAPLRLVSSQRGY